LHLALLRQRRAQLSQFILLQLTARPLKLLEFSLQLTDQCHRGRHRLVLRRVRRSPPRPILDLLPVARSLFSRRPTRLFLLLQLELRLRLLQRSSQLSLPRTIL